MERIGERVVHNAQVTIITTMLKNRMQDSFVESSSDEEWEAAVKRIRIRRRRVHPHDHTYSDHVMPSVMPSCNAHEFNCHFR